MTNKRGLFSLTPFKCGCPPTHTQGGEENVEVFGDSTADFRPLVQLPEKANVTGEEDESVAFSCGCGRERGGGGRGRRLVLHVWLSGCPNAPIPLLSPSPLAPSWHDPKP